ncbi:MAG: hypothetical protein H7247_03960 [Polaromonas sp.]|nr:hypothetical protein [Gemmatimonadaceae bacterium]
MKALKFAAVALVLSASTMSAQSMAKDTGKAMKKPAAAAKASAMAAHSEAKAAEKTADKAMAMAKDAKMDAKAANMESHEAMEKPAMPKKKHKKGKGMAKGMMMKDTTMMTKKP